ncbi:MBL fold metallo-hydrolase [Streptomyces sp. NPDC091271]|uniref:MBL fold metallo-hydrolase n=1 Tax=Streptomyces sp. NPDC091271 TaxID=3365980 RepID=UPI0037FA237D
MSAADPGLRPLPPVERVRPGLWSVPVPLPNTSLRYVLVHVFETDAGPYLVDAGWDTDEAFEALSAGLTAIGTRVEDVRGVMVSHVHPDHYGLAHRVREVSGAWVSLHPADAAVLDRLEGDRPVESTTATLRASGAPREVLERHREAMARFTVRSRIPRPDLLLDDGAEPEVPGWNLTGLWTPGHSPGHMCFWEPRYALLLSGDHVLPRITPNVPPPTGANDDTLGAYLRSLERLEGLDAVEVLPAHEHRFAGLGGRLAELRGHHESRFKEVLTALEAGARTVWEVAGRMSWSRPWESMDGFAQRAAAGEAFAHLRALARRAEVHEESGEPLRWRVVRAADEAWRRPG